MKKSMIVGSAVLVICLSLIYLYFSPKRGGVFVSMVVTVRNDKEVYGFEDLDSMILAMSAIRQGEDKKKEMFVDLFRQGKLRVFDPGTKLTIMDIDEQMAVVVPSSSGPNLQKSIVLRKAIEDLCNK